MGVDAKLKTWVRAGLMDEVTRARILEFEEHASRPWALYTLGGLGVFSVVLGIISVIASNWDGIPGLLKIAVDLLAVAGVAKALHTQDEAGKGWAREVLLLLLFGLVVASIGLIAQVYQLGGKPWQALLAWSLMTLPAMWLFGRTPLSAMAAVLALNASILASLVEWLDPLHWNDSTKLAVALLVGGGLPLLHIQLGQLGRLERARPEWAAALRDLGWAALLLGSNVLQQLWYDSSSRLGEETEGAWQAAPVLVLAAVAMSLAAGKRLRHGPPWLLSAWRMVLMFMVVAPLLPLLIPHEQVGLAAAFSMMVGLGLCAFLAYQQRSVQLFNVAAMLLAMRVLGVFLELFGNLLTTGLGLIVGGVATLLAARFWLAKMKQMREQMRDGRTL